MLAGLGVSKAVVIPAFFKLMAPVGIDFDPAKMPAGYKLVEKNPDSYIYDITAPPTRLVNIVWDHLLLRTPVILVMRAVAAHHAT